MNKHVEVHTVKLHSLIDLRRCHGAVITVHKDVTPLQGVGVVIEPRALSENVISFENRPVEFE